MINRQWTGVFGLPRRADACGAAVGRVPHAGRSWQLGPNMSGISRGLPDRGAVGAPQEGQNLEESASPFFALSCGLAGVVLTYCPSWPERWNVGRPRKPGAASWVCFLVVPTSPTILRGVVFSGVNLMVLILSLPFLYFFIRFANGLQMKIFS